MSADVCPDHGRTAHDEQQPDVHFSLDAVADEAHKAHYEPYDEVGTCGYKGVYPEESDDYGQTDASENQTYRSTNQPYDGAGKPLNSGLAWSDGRLSLLASPRTAQRVRS